jgi:hypothetical protein
MFKESAITIVKMVILPKANYRLNVVPISTPVMFLSEPEKKPPKIHMEVQKNPNSQSNPGQK